MSRIRDRNRKDTTPLFVSEVSHHREELQSQTRSAAKAQSFILFAFRAPERSQLKEITMKTRMFATLGDRIAKISALMLCTLLTFPALAQSSLLNVFPAIAVNSPTVQLPKGVKVVACVSLEGMPVTGMYTQREYGRTYLYIEHGQQSITSVDVTKKRNPRLVDHAPAKVDPVVYEQLFEGGTIEISHRQVFAGIDNVGGRGMFSVLDKDDLQDAKMLEALGQGNRNVVDRDSPAFLFSKATNLIEMASDLRRSFQRFGSVSLREPPRRPATSADEGECYVEAA